MLRDDFFDLNEVALKNAEGEKVRRGKGRGNGSTRDEDHGWKKTNPTDAVTIVTRYLL